MSEFDRLNTHYECPSCGSPEFVIGPTAGLALNIRCVGCGEKYWFCPPFTPERINNADSLYTGRSVNLRKYVP